MSTYTIQGPEPGVKLGNHHDDAHSGLKSAVLDLDARVTSMVFNVKWFGAVGDGVTDDSAAIQAAFDAVPAAGGTVYFPIANYKVVTGIVCNNKAGVYVEGAGKGFTSGTGVIASGSKLVGVTPGMTILTIKRDSGGGPQTKHAGPTVTHMSFEDGTTPPSKRSVAITNAVWAAGVATFTIDPSLNIFNIGDVVYLDKATKFSPGTDWDNIYTLTYSTGGTLKANRVSDPGAWVAGGGLEFENNNAARTMTGLKIGGITRHLTEHNTFGLLNKGIFVDASLGDCSWSTERENDFIDCNVGVDVSGGTAGLTIWGGSAQIGTAQIGYRIANAAAFRIGSMKLDVGRGTSAENAIGINIIDCAKFSVLAPVFEDDVDIHGAVPVTWGVKVEGSASKCWGDITSPQFQGSNNGGNANLVAIGIYGSGASTNAHAINIIGGTYQNHREAIHLDQYAENITVIGGQVISGDMGINIESGAAYVELFGFQSLSGLGYTHITDPGGAIVNQVGCDDAANDVPDGIRSTQFLGTQHVGGATPSGGRSGDIMAGTGGLWFNDDGTWSLLVGVAAPAFSSTLERLLAEVSTASTGDHTVLTHTFPANSLKEGTVIRVTLYGKITTGGAPSTLGAKVSFGPTHNGTVLFTPTASVTDRGIKYEAIITCRAVDGSNMGTFVDGLMLLADAASSANKTNVTCAGGTYSFAVDVDQDLVAKITLTTADGTTTIYAETCTIELVNP